ncbi:MAG TPA: hypothetical protein VIS99_11880, partial [Terrimicrobiaceae bacterium]
MSKAKTTRAKMPVIRDFPAPTTRHVLSNRLKIFRWARRLVVPLAFLAFVIIYKLDVKYYISLTLEDNIVEWLTFGLLLGSGLLAVFLAARTFGQARRPAIFFGIFGLCCVLFAFEEISWGQRVLHIKSPSFFLENSSQREINVHNVIQKKFHIKTKHIAGLTLFVYGVCLPL